MIVVDDGSSDATAAIAQGFEGVCYVHQENAGPAAARNHGARIATGEVVALTDSDCIAEPNWIEELITGFDASNVVAVGGTYGIANPESPLARIIHAEIQLRHEQFGDTVDFLGSFNVAYKRDVYLDIGGFDENFRSASGEDNDLAYRLHDAGGVMRFVPTAIVNHYHPTKLYPYLKTQMNHGFWRMKLYAKHPKRSGGDQYAGKLDFLAIPLALLCTFVLFIVYGMAFVFLGLLILVWLDINFGYDIGSFLSSFFGLYWKSILCMGIVWGFLHCLYVSISRNRNKIIDQHLGTWSPLQPDQESAKFYKVFSYRDLFRGLGLIKGVVYFIIMRKETIK